MVVSVVSVGEGEGEGEKGEDGWWVVGVDGET